MTEEKHKKNNGKNEGSNEETDKQDLLDDRDRQLVGFHAFTHSSEYFINIGQFFVQNTQGEAGVSDQWAQFTNQVIQFAKLGYQLVFGLCGEWRTSSGQLRQFNYQEVADTITQTGSTTPKTAQVDTAYTFQCVK